MQFTGLSSELVALLKNAIRDADAVLIGAGAGLSTAAGFTYSGKRFEKNFSDFIEKCFIDGVGENGGHEVVFPDEIRR